jgi:hypothetical protein
LYCGAFEQVDEFWTNSEREAVPVSVVYQTGRVQSGGLKSFVGAARAALPGCPEL